VITPCKLQLPVGWTSEGRTTEGTPLSHTAPPDDVYTPAETIVAKNDVGFTALKTLHRSPTTGGTPEVDTMMMPEMPHTHGRRNKKSTIGNIWVMRESPQKLYSCCVKQHTSQRETARKSHHDAASKSSQGWQLIPLDSTKEHPKSAR
jgi:hypothetical protein